MQRALAFDGVEWSAADMTFDQTGRINRVKNGEIVRTGTGGVYTGGVVTVSAGLVHAISGPLKFQANGELGLITSPANVTLAALTTNYVIAVYGETTDTPATYYGGGAPPNIHANETPTVIARGTTAVLSNGEILLATVVTNGVTSTSITDNRVILMSGDNSGNQLLGPGATIDGMDPSVHVGLVGSPTVVGHSKLGGIGGATPYGTLGGAWLRESFYDIGSAIASGTILDDTNFSSPPASSQPFLTTGAAFNTQYLPTRNGDLMDAAYGPRLMARYTLTFTATGVVSLALGIGHWDQTIRVKANGVTLFSNAGASGGSGQVVNFNTVGGTNTIVVYVGNCDGNQCGVNLICAALTNSGFVFTG